MYRIISDQAQIETSGRVLELISIYVIDNWNSEPRQQRQTYVERKYKHIKQTTNCIMKISGSPAYYWLLELLYVCFIPNYTAITNLKWRTPLKILTGTISDINPLLRVYWWQSV